MGNNDIDSTSATIYVKLINGDGNISELTSNSNKRKKHVHNQNRKKGKKNKRKRKKNRGKKKRKNKNGRVKLVPPSRPSVTQLSDSSVLLNWTVPENDGLAVTFFRVQYKEVAPVKSSWKTEDKEIPKNVRKYEVDNLKKGGTYKFRIAAVYTNKDNNVGQNSPRFQLRYESISNPIGLTPAEAPTIVEAKPIVFENVYGIGVRWQYRASDSPLIQGFIIYYKPYDDPGEYIENVLPGASVREYLLKYLQSDTEYSIKMQSFNEAGKSDYSNIVVKRTRGKLIGNVMPSIAPMRPARPTRPPKKSTTTRKSPPTIINHDNSSNQSNGQMLYMILGIAFGVLLLILVVFMFMCWWKQRQQRRMPVMNGAIHSKFQDQSQRIYTDSLRKKYINGGYPSNGYITNGHGPSSKMNINVNHMSSENMSLSRHTGNGKYYHNRLPNGVVSVDHMNSSDNNFNTINSHKPSDEISPMLSDCDRVSDAIDIGDPQLVYRPNCCGNHHYHQTLPVHSSGDLSTADSCRDSPRPKIVNPPHYECIYKSEDRLAHNCYIDDNLEPSERQSYNSLSPTDHTSGHHNEQLRSKHRHRRKHRHSREQQPTRDQATNTDLSSNEGTIEFTTFNKPETQTEITPAENLECSEVLHTNSGV